MPWAQTPRYLRPGSSSETVLLLREEGVAHVEHLWREHRNPATVERGDLVQRVADRRRGSDDQWSDRGVALLVGGEHVDGVLEDADGGAERAGDEV